MFKFLKNKRVKTIFLATLVLFSLNVFAPSNEAYAAIADCDGEKAMCTIDKDESCPPENYQEGTSSDDAIKVCNLKGASSSFDEIINSVKVVGAIQSVLNAVLWPILFLIGGLMDNELLFGAGMQERLRAIWIIMRNLVNIMFVVLLVGVALYNIVGVGDENSDYSVKSALPKIIVGIILVNFSFTLSKVILDGVNVLTTSVFLLPTNVGEELSKIEITDSNEEQVCKALENLDGSIVSEDYLKTLQKEKVYFNHVGNEFTTTEASALGLNTYSQGMEKLKELADQAEGKDDKSNEVRAKKVYDKITKATTLCSGSVFTDEGKAWLTKFNSRNAAFAMAVNMAKITFYKEIPTNTKTIDSALVNGILSMLLYLAFAAAFIALFVVLLVRLVVLWVGIAMSPLLIIIYGSPDLKDKLGGIGEISGEFLANAIAPLKVALALTVGWIMLQTVGGMNGLENSFPVGSAQGFPVVGVSSLQQLIIAIGVLVVVFKGAFSAADGTIAKDIVGTIQSAATDAAKYVGQIPLRHISAIPVKLPGQEGDPFMATPMQALRAVQSGMADTSKDNVLANMLNPNARADTSDLHKITDKDKMNRFLVDNAKLKSGDEGFQTSLKEHLNRNRTLQRQILDTSTPLGKAYDQYLKATDDAGRKSAGKRIQELLRGQGVRPLTRSELDGPATPAAQTANPPAANPDSSALPAVTTVTATTTIGGQKPAEIEAANTDIASGTVEQTFKTGMEKIQTIATKEKPASEAANPELVTAVRAMGDIAKKTDGFGSLDKFKTEFLGGSNERLTYLASQVGGTDELEVLLGIKEAPEGGATGDGTPGGDGGTGGGE